MHAHERNRASYLPENIVPLMEAQKLDLVEGEQEIAPGVFTLPTPGHTAHHQSVRVEDGNGHSLVFLGDVMPTSVHLRLPFIMAYDLNVVDTLESKRMLVTRAEAEKWLFVFGHDIETPAAYVKKDDKGQFVVGEKVSL